MAIIGDSYIEGFQIDIEKNIAANIRRSLKGTCDVYGFGISGACLAEYLQISRYVHKMFRPDIMVINVVHNDFDESLCTVKSDPGRLCIDVRDGTVKESPIMPYAASQFRRSISRSALVRYLYHNLKIVDLNWVRMFGNTDAEQAYSENIDVLSLNRHMTAIEKACNYIIEKIAQENSECRIMFVIDAPRTNMYLGQLENSKIIWMNRLLEDLCSRKSVQYLDLTNPFLSHYKKTGVRFESKWDWHWNEIGHEVAAQAVCAKIEELGWLSR